MKDEKGLYYYPDPSDPKSRVYVREGAGGVEFRLWHADRPEVWDRHDWLALNVIEAAAAMFRERGSASDPMALYDVNVARALIRDAARLGH